MGAGAFLQLVVTQATMLRRNVGFWLSSIIMAALSMAVFGWLFNPDTQPFDLALVDEDHSQASRTLMEAFEGIDSVETREGSRDGELASRQDGGLAGVAPLRPGSLIASQAASFSIVSLMQVTIVLLMGHLVFDVDIHGSFLLLAVTVFLGVMAMLSIGYVVASLVKTVTSVNAVINLVAFPMMFLGGCYFPLEPPPALKPVIEAIPLTHLNDALREGVNQGGGLGDIWLSWGIPAAWGVGGFGLSMRLFRWQ